MSESSPFLPVFKEGESVAPELVWVDSASRMLDTKFRIPGTDIRFGADFLLGLFPGVGDVISFGFSGVLVMTLAKNGASPMLAARMLFNVILDLLVGSIPVLGNIFDLFYKANYRNVQLMQEYYVKGEHRGSVWPVVLGVLAVVVLILGLLIWGVIAFFDAVFGAVFG